MYLCSLCLLYVCFNCKVFFCFCHVCPTLISSFVNSFLNVKVLLDHKKKAKTKTHALFKPNYFLYKYFFINKCKNVFFINGIIIIIFFYYHLAVQITSSALKIWWWTERWPLKSNVLSCHTPIRLHHVDHVSAYFATSLKMRLI